jgi:hypothetical protein
LEAHFTNRYGWTHFQLLLIQYDPNCRTNPQPAAEVLQKRDAKYKRFTVLARAVLVSMYDIWRAVAVTEERKTAVVELLVTMERKLLVNLPPLTSRGMSMSMKSAKAFVMFSKGALRQMRRDEVVSTKRPR